MTEQREAAVDRLSGLLERDVIGLDEYRSMVDRVLAAVSDAEVEAVLGSLPVPVRDEEDDTLELSCAGGVVKEVPGRLPAVTEIRCESGVMKVDLRWATLDLDEVELEIENGQGVLKVVFPRDVTVEVVDHRSGGGVFKSRLRRRPPDPLRPRVLLRVRNDAGVVKVVQRRWGPR